MQLSVLCINASQLAVLLWRRFVSTIFSLCPDLLQQTQVNSDATMAAVLQVTANLATTMDGGTKAITFLGIENPSTSLEKAEKHLNSAVSTMECIVEKKPHCISKKEIEDLHILQGV